jgi:ankyrin repeat protein
VLEEREPGTWVTDASANERHAIQDALEYACRNGRVEAAAFLLERGADVEGSGFFGASPLHWAAGQGTPEMVRFLLSRGADAERRDPTFDATPFGWAAEHRKEDNLRVLREHGYRPDVWEAACAGYLDIVKEWIDHSRPLLDAVRWGTPLAEASAWNRPEVVRWLLGEGADLDVATKDGKSPQEVAREQGHHAIVAMLERVAARTPLSTFRREVTTSLTV